MEEVHITEAQSAPAWRSLGGAIAQRPRGDGVEEGVSREHDERADNQFTPTRAEHGDQRAPHSLAALECPGEHRRLGQSQPHIEPDRHHHRGLGRNADRHPQLKNGPPRSASTLLWPSQLINIRNSPLASRKPNGAPSCGHIAARALLSGSAVSVTSSAAPPHSPPNARPWLNLMIASSTGAATPTCW